jgi:hypothetical protein
MRLSPLTHNRQVRFGENGTVQQNLAGKAMQQLLSQYTTLTNPKTVATLSTLNAYLEAASSGNAPVANLMADGLKQGVRNVPAPRLSLDSGGNFYQTIDTFGYKRPVPTEFSTLMPAPRSTNQSTH